MRVGVIGAGTIGQLRAQSVKEHSELDLAGVADVDEDRATRAVAGSGGRAYADYRQLLAASPLDAVFVATPLPDHEGVVTAALAAGLHVLCEKPLSNTIESCRRMLAAAEAAGRCLAVGFNHRYYPAITFLKHAVDDGAIGTLDHLRIFGGHDGLANFRADWQYKAPASGGGAMMDVGIHMTDLTRYLLGDITRVYGVSSNRIWNIEGSEDNAMAVLTAPSGISALYQATWTEWKGYRFFIDAYGDRGMVRGYYAPMFNLLVTQSRPGGRRRRVRKFYPEIILREKLKSWTSTALLSFKDELGDFLRLLDGRKTNLASGFDGLRAVEIAHAVQQSSVTGSAVTLSR